MSGAPKGAVAALSRSVLLRAGARTTGSGLEVSDGARQYRLGDGEPQAKLEVNDHRAYSAVLRSGSVGVGRSYVEGWWDSDDLTSVVRALYAMSSGLRRGLDRFGRSGAPWVGASRRGPRPDAGTDRRNIGAHYDLSNEFFELMLDPTMTYSCAVFPSTMPAEASARGGQSRSALEEAQLAKLDLICTKLELSPRDHLVEVGTGWGGLAVHAAGNYGCRVTTTTISSAQYEYATKRVARAGLGHLVSVVSQDWRQLSGSYDKLVSVEMVEAVDWRLYRRLMARFAGLLRDDGLGLVQAIVIDDASFDRAKRHNDFVREMVFPGSCIPSVSALVAAMARGSDLRLVDMEDIGQHYAPTLAAWRANLRRNQAKVDGLGIPQRVQRLWALYLAYCEASFLEGHISDVQMLMAKPGRLRRDRTERR